jgi:hypothetical protein
MNKTYVYKITRNDGLEYVGITINPKARKKSHLKSMRFAIGIKDFKILKECGTYKEAERLEEVYIQQFDTYENGLNLTLTGKGLNDIEKFNTYGHKFSEKSKKKMSESAKKRGLNVPIGFKHSEDTKKHWSNIRKNKVYGPIKLTREQWLELYTEFKEDRIQFESEYIARFVKKTQKLNVCHIAFSELKSGNGKPLTKETLYSNYYAEKFNVTPQAIRVIFKNKGIMADAI